MFETYFFKITVIIHKFEEPSNIITVLYTLNSEQSFFLKTESGVLDGYDIRNAKSENGIFYFKFIDVDAIGNN